MRKALFLALIICCSKWISAQITLTGTVQDTLNKKQLAHAVVALLQKKDSSLFRFTRTGSNGQFVLSNLPPGQYLFMVTYPGCADFVDPLQVGNGPTQSAGKISMTLMSRLMETVVVRSGAAIRIKGDTTEFAADSFHVKEGATVEELLKKLPGFQVNSKGEIVAQGQKVQKVLVDGEEFFGDDPTLATRNISARAVDKVQLFDNKSEQQQLTGITSGNEGKTVNIKLKEDQKKGAFGKAEAGTNFGRIMDARAMYNRFVGKKKFSVYGSKSTSSSGNLSWDDKRKLGMDNDWEYDEVSGYYYSFSTGDEFNDWTLRGYPNAYSAGALFINKWKQDQQSINASYTFNRLATNNVTNLYELNRTPGATFERQSTSRSDGWNRKHALSGKYEWKIDSLSSLKVTSAASQRHTDSYKADSSVSTSSNGPSVYNRGSTDQQSDRSQVETQIQYRQNFRKKNRLLLGTIRLGLTDDDQHSMFYSGITYRTNGTLDSTRIFDQQKINTGQSRTWGARVSFNEPLTDKWNLITEYSYNRNASESRRNTLEKDANGKYEVLNQLFSNRFDLDVDAHSGQALVRFMSKKFRMSAGSGVSSISLRLYNLDQDTRNRYRFFNFTPQLSMNYNVKAQSAIGLNYKGTTHQPTIEELQPLRNNTDPLNEVVGNPGLQVGFNHSLTLFFNSYKVLSQRSIFGNATIELDERDITQSSTLLANGKRIYQPVNVDGNYNVRGWMQWSKAQTETRPYTHFELRGNGGRRTTFVNGFANRTRFYTIGTEIGIGYEKEEAWSIDLSPSIDYNYSLGSLAPDQQNRYWSYGGDVEASVFLPFKIELQSECEFNLRQRLPGFEGNPNIILWKAGVKRKFFKDKSLILSFTANDILNRNQGFTRIINSERIFQESFQRVSQYFLFKVEWNFTKSKIGE